MLAATHKRFDGTGSPDWDSRFPVRWVCTSNSRSARSRIDNCTEILLVQFANPLFEEPTLGLLPCQGQSLPVRLPGLRRPPEPATHIGPGGVRKVILAQFPVGEDFVDPFESGLRPIAHRQGDGPIEFDDR